MKDPSIPSITPIKLYETPSWSAVGKIKEDLVDWI
jgi:hypothetical protein